MTHKLTLFLSITAIVVDCLCCKPEPSAPTASNQLQIRIDTTVLSWQDSIWAIGGPGFYYKYFTVQHYRFDPLWGDSVVNMLLDANLSLVEFWYPANGGICRVPFVGMLEISRLNHPDTTIYRFGYRPLPKPADTMHICIREWRHYTIVR